MTALFKSPVEFREEDHTYWLDGKQLMGVTSTLIRRAFPDKYGDVDPEVLANAARKGKELHQLIEFHDSFNTNADEHEDERVRNYERIKKENLSETIANEYLVSDEKNYASSIDVVWQDKSTNDIILIDIKTTYELDTESVALQLSIYKRWFERQNPHLKVSQIAVMWLPNKDHSIAQLHYLTPVPNAIIDELIEADLADRTFDITKAYGNLPALVEELQDEIIRIEVETKRMKSRQDEMKKTLYEAMERCNLKCFDGLKVRITRVLPTETETLDTAKLKEDEPEIYAGYLKRSKRAGSLKITIKK